MYLSALIVAGLFAVPFATTPAVAAVSTGTQSLSKAAGPIGKYAVLASHWEQWALSQPNATSPFLHTDEKFCALGQRGPVWFLGAGFHHATLSRTCTVPAGKDLFFPLVNAAYFAFPDDPPEQRTVAFVRAQVAPFNVRQATNLSTTVDGKAVNPRRIQFERSVIFATKVPAGGFFNQTVPSPPGFIVDSPCADEGYYVLLEALKPGVHTIHQHGEIPVSPQVPAPGALDVTYHITVAKAR